MQKLPTSGVVPTFLLGYMLTSLWEGGSAGLVEVPRSLEPATKIGNFLAQVLGRPEIQSWAVPTVAAGAAFAVTARLWQLSAYTMAVSAGNLVIGPLVGTAGVVAASVMASETFRKSRGERVDVLAAMSVGRDVVLPSGLGVLFFGLLGGRWTHLVPSNLLAPGAFGDRRFARLLSPRLLAANRREAQSALGEVAGCHTCGTQTGPFIADLTPPTRIFATLKSLTYPQSQVYLPQCRPCGRRASEVVRQTSSGSFWQREMQRHRELQLHIAAVRPHDLTGALIALVLLGGELQHVSDSFTLS